MSYRSPPDRASALVAGYPNVSLVNVLDDTGGKKNHQMLLIRKTAETPRGYGKYKIQVVQRIFKAFTQIRELPSCQ